MRRFLATALAALLLTACGAAPDTGSTRLVVFAAASLTAPFTTIGKAFEKAHPGATVVFSFEGSTTLVEQLEQGAPADVLASADTITMDRAVRENLVAGTPQVFATNTMTLIVPAGNPAGITGFDDSLRGTKLVVCAPAVPCGAAARSLAALDGVPLQPVSEESKVTDVRTKVETGEADAGIVYVTDAAISGSKVESFPIPRADQVRNDYPLAVPRSAAHPSLAAEFVAMVKGPAGRTALSSAGFALP